MEREVMCSYPNLPEVHPKAWEVVIEEEADGTVFSLSLFAGLGCILDWGPSRTARLVHQSGSEWMSLMIQYSAEAQMHKEIQLKKVIN